MTIESDTGIEEDTYRAELRARATDSEHTTQTNMVRADTSEAQQTRAFLKFLERILMPMLIAAAASLFMLLCIATYEYGTGSRAVPFSIENWTLILASSILVLLGILAVISDPYDP